MAGEDHNDEDKRFVLPSPHLFSLLWQLGHAVALVFFRGERRTGGSASVFCLRARLSFRRHRNALRDKLLVGYFCWNSPYMYFRSNKIIMLVLT
ncbi:hypothetical protein PF010_g32794, partial [Phytophthora fragariae]